MSETHHTVDPKFTYRDKRSGKDVVLYQGLLDAAHRAGLVYIETTILQFPCAENDQTCIVKATVTLSDPDQPRVFSAIGDANARNVGANIAPHFIRMAETRAKARALRDILNVGTVSVEELGGDEDAHQHDNQPTRAPARFAAPPAPRPAAAPTVAAGQPYTKEEYVAAIKTAWEMQEAGDAYPAIVAYMKTHRDRLTPDQLADSREEMRLLKAAMFPDIAAVS